MDQTERAEILNKIEKLLYYENPSALGETIARELGDYTVAFIMSKNGEFRPAGTGTLVSFCNSHYLLTAAHVWEEKLIRADAILIPLKENTQRRFTIKPREIVAFGPASPAQWSEWGPDIKLLRIPPQRVGEIMAVGRSFYNLSKKKEMMFDCALETRFLMGAPAERGTFTVNRAYPELQAMLVYRLTRPYSAIGAPADVRSAFDYVDLDVDVTQPDVAQRFGGVSGGGVWKVWVYKSGYGQFQSFKVLDGVAFWASPYEAGLIVRCHGPQTIGTALRYAPK
jgi:hypothetical protein